MIRNIGSIWNIIKVQIERKTIKEAFDMFNKKDFLRFAFEEATTVVSVNSVESTAIKSVLRTRMRDYARHNGLEFSEKEIGETIVEGLKMLNHAKEDFAY